MRRLLEDNKKLKNSVQLGNLHHPGIYDSISKEDIGNLNLHNIYKRLSVI